MNLKTFDLIIVGAGLAGLSLAHCLRKNHPHWNIKIIDQAPHFSPDKTWSFHHHDLQNFELWKDFISYSWPRYEVQFSYTRLMNEPYYTINSQDFFAKMQNSVGGMIEWGVKAIEIHSQHVVTLNLKTQETETLHAKLVIDARQVNKSSSFAEMEEKGWGFQKFWGLEVKTQEPHGLTHPILMDATVEQKDGYRFIYLLPYSESTLLIEDTRYSNRAFLEDGTEDVLTYARQKNWVVEKILRTESGVLPIPMRANLLNSGALIVAGQEPAKEVLKIGTRAGFFHPVTGYSFLWSTLVAEKLAQINEPDYEKYAAALEQLHQERLKTESFYFILNRMLFHGAAPEIRKNIFQRFYKLPDKTISRFYAARTNWPDRIRILVGKPPIPVKSAIKSLTQNYKEVVL
jgi:lycopene beta-cyclase